MKTVLCALATLALVLVPILQAEAGPITYEEQATASGTLGKNAFTNALVTIIFTGDTANVVNGGGGFFSNSVGTTTITVAGIGTATFTDSMVASFDNQTFAPTPAAGIDDVTVGGSVLDTFNSTFGTYDLTTPIGPVSGSSFIRSDLSYGTTLGSLNFSSAGNSTFTATTAAATTPEPATLTIFGLGVVAAAGYGWRKRK